MGCCDLDSVESVMIDGFVDDGLGFVCFFDAFDMMRYGGEGEGKLRVKNQRENIFLEKEILGEELGI